MSNIIRIMLVDDHAVVREGLRSILDQQPDMMIVSEAEDGVVALELLPIDRPDVVLLDIKIPGPSIVNTISAIKTLRPECHVLVFTSHSEESVVREVLTVGATGYLVKDAMRDDLLRAVREVAKGKAWLHPHAQKQMLDWMRRPPSPFEALTTRERSVLGLIAAGLSNKQIARELDLTEGTIKGYVSHILDKLNVEDRTQAALLAHRDGFGGAKPG